jgi:L-fucose isomerase-like protein
VEDAPKMDYQAIIAGTVGKDNTYGTIVGRLKAKPFTYCRVSTDDLNGRILSYIGEGELTNDPLSTFGGYGVVCIPNFQKAADLYLRKRVRTPRCHQPVAGGARAQRSLHQVPGLEHVLP